MFAVHSVSLCTVIVQLFVGELGVGKNEGVRFYTVPNMGERA
jgi:hypothetical protein